MTLTEYIKAVYEKWDGTEEQAAICLRYVNLAITRWDLAPDELMIFIEENEQRN